MADHGTPKPGHVTCMLAILLAVPLAARALEAPVAAAPDGTSHADGKPKLVVERPVVELGRVIEGDVADIVWRLENRGNADLVIEGTRAGCGCTVVDLSELDTTIEPGTALELKASFNSVGRRGEQRKHVYVFSNDPEQESYKLEFTADVAILVDMDPAMVLNMRMVNRNSSGARGVKMLPGPGFHELEVLEVDLEDSALGRYESEKLTSLDREGVELRFFVSQTASLGPLVTSARIRFRVDDLERERILQIRGEVVGELVWRPKVVNATAIDSRRGNQLSPVLISSTNDTPFEILGADAGPILDAAVEAVDRSQQTQYNVSLTIREDAPPGPFAATLSVRTDSADQPIVSVPVFGIVAPLLEVDPPLVILRQDGTPSGQTRQVRLRKTELKPLHVKDLRCDLPGVLATVDLNAGREYDHIRFVVVRWEGQLPAGKHRSTLVVATESEGELEIPLVVEVP